MTTVWLPIVLEPCAAGRRPTPASLLGPRVSQLKLVKRQILTVDIREIFILSGRGEMNMERLADGYVIIHSLSPRYGRLREQQRWSGW